AAAAAAGPLAPTPAATDIRDLVNDHQNGVCNSLAEAIDLDVQFRSRQSHTLAAIFESPAEIAEGVAGIQIVIARQQIGLVLCNYHVSIRGDQRVRGEAEVYSGGKLPAAQIDGVGAFIVEF